MDPKSVDPNPIIQPTRASQLEGVEVHAVVRQTVGLSDTRSKSRPFHARHTFSPITHMKHFLKIKRKKSPEPPLQPVSPGNPVGITPGPPGPGFRQELDAASGGK